MSLTVASGVWMDHLEIETPLLYNYGICSSLSLVCVVTSKAVLPSTLPTTRNKFTSTALQLVQHQLCTRGHLECYKIHQTQASHSAIRLRAAGSLLPADYSTSTLPCLNLLGIGLYSVPSTRHRHRPTTDQLRASQILDSSSKEHT